MSGEAEISKERAAELYPIALDNYRNAWAGLHLIREALEELAPPETLHSEEYVVAQYGPEPIHEAQAIVEALHRWAAAQNNAA